MTDPAALVPIVAHPCVTDMPTVVATKPEVVTINGATTTINLALLSDGTVRWGQE